MTAALDTPIATELWPRMTAHREYMRFQSGSVDPADCRIHAALAELESTGSDWLPAAEVLTAFLEVGFFGRAEDAFARVRRLTSPRAEIPPYWRHRAQMLLGFLLAATGQGDEAVEAHRTGMHEAIEDGDHSAAHVLMFFAAMGLIRVHRRNEVDSIMVAAERLLTLLPSRQTEACIELVALILAVFDGEDIDALADRLEHPTLDAIFIENRHLANLRDGALGLAHGARGDRAAARARRETQDDDVATGFFGESIVWAELGLALAATAHGDLEDARRHVEAARPWEQTAGLVASEADVIAIIIDAAHSSGNGRPDLARQLLDEALAAPSLFGGLISRSAAVERAAGVTAN